MTDEKFKVSPEELVAMYKCLSSKLCLRIFHIMKRHKELNITAISRKAGCSNKTSIKHLRNMARLNIIEEELYSGLHKFTLKNGLLTELMDQTVKLLKKEEEENAP